MHLKTDYIYSTMPELMELIEYVMKKRKESDYLTSSQYALYQAIKMQSKELLTRDQGLYKHEQAVLNKHQV